MGLFDTIGGMLGQGQGEGAAAGGPMGALGGLLQGHEGGLPGLIGAFQNAGLGGAVSSWISQGANQGVSADQIRQVLGNGPIEQFAEKMGVTPEMAAQHISELLPQVVDHLTPTGQVPEAGTDALTNLLNTFKR